MSHPALRLYDGYDHTSPDLQGEVKELQSALSRKGFDMKADGYFGLETEAAVGGRRGAGDQVIGWPT